MLNSKIKRRLTQFVNSIFLKTDYNYQRVFTKFWFVIILLLGLTVILIRIPPIIEWVISKNSQGDFIQNLKLNNIVWKKWLTFGMHTLEVFLIFLFGGAIYSEWVTNFFKKKVNELQIRREKEKTKKLIETKQKTEKLFEESIEIINTTNKRNLIRNLFKIIKKSRDAYYLINNDIWEVNFSFILNKLGVNFPGGLYGLIGFISFIVLYIFKTIDSYVDYLK